MKHAVILVLCIVPIVVKGQKKDGLEFDINGFNKKMDVVEWLCSYDLVAWWTSDSVMAQDKKETDRLGKEWFCYQDLKNIWHAVYGKYENGIFDLVFHFKVESESRIIRVYESIDSSILHSYSRALITANKRIAALKDSVKIHFNQYIKQNEDKTFSVWIFPAFQPNGQAVYGGEFIYTIDQTGNKVLRDDSYYQGAFHGFVADTSKEIWLDYKDVEKPTLGAIFFVWYYKQYFNRIFIDCSKSKSTVFRNENNAYYWVHGEKE